MIRTLKAGGKFISEMNARQQKKVEEVKRMMNIQAMERFLKLNTSNKISFERS